MVTYHKFNDKIYRIKYNNGFFEAEEYNQKTGAFTREYTVTPTDIQTRGIELSTEEILKIIR